MTSTYIYRMSRLQLLASHPISCHLVTSSLDRKPFECSQCFWHTSDTRHKSFESYFSIQSFRLYFFICFFLINCSHSLKMFSKSSNRFGTTSIFGDQSIKDEYRNRQRRLSLIGGPISGTSPNRRESLVRELRTVSSKSL